MGRERGIVLQGQSSMGVGEVMFGVGGDVGVWRGGMVGGVECSWWGGMEVGWNGGGTRIWLVDGGARAQKIS